MCSACRTWWATSACSAAFNPLKGLAYLFGNGMAGFLSLGSIFLVVTGGEALYADMGHFGRSPIRSAGSPWRCRA